MPADELSLSQIVTLMKNNGVTKIYGKFLALRNNSKNQIYLGPNFSAITLLPNMGIEEDTSSKWGNFKARLNMFWLQRDGSINPAPHAKLILYPQYPEVRLSGFLLGAHGAPSEILTTKTQNRILFFGISSDSRIIAYAVHANSPAANEISEMTDLSETGVFFQLPILTHAGVQNSKDLLLQELHRIHELGWINAKRFNRDRIIVDCNNRNCGGYTLEAELGIIPNAISEPDFLGWEVKQYNVSNFNRIQSGNAVTLMTPEPSGGYYVDQGFEAFIRQFGYEDQQGRSDRMNFGGVHKLNTVCQRTKLMLCMKGYDRESNQIVDVTGKIFLLAQDDVIAASWDFRTILEHWSRKHNQAVYVPSKVQKTPVQQYKYGHIVLLGEGTDPTYFLKALCDGIVYYDPGMKISNLSTKPETKRRSQYRVHPKFIPTLYDTATPIDITDPQ